MNRESQEIQPGGNTTHAKTLNRRRFIKAAVGSALIAGTATADTFHIPKIEVKEWNPDISKHLVMIDFAPETFSPDFIQWMYYSDDELLKRELGENYLGEIKRTAVGATYLGVNKISEHVEPANDFFDKFGLDGSMEQLFLRHNPHYAIGSAALDAVGDHGSGVNHVMWQTINHYRQDQTGITPRIYPIQKTMDIDFNEDEIGNFTLIAKVSPEKVSEALTHYPLQDIVNFSWQAGDVRFTVRTHTVDPDDSVRELEVPEISKTGAYRAEKAEENLRELFSVCNTHPEKLFFCALGNLGDDVREARESMKSIWPENILLIGEWQKHDEDDYGRPKYNSYGGDLYVVNKLGDKQFADGSSMSTGITSATASHMRSFSIPRVDIPGLLLRDFSDEVFYHAGNKAGKHDQVSLEKTRLFNSQLYESFLGHRYTSS